MVSHLSLDIMKKLTITLISFIALGSIAFAWLSYTKTVTHPFSVGTKRSPHKTAVQPESKKLRAKATEAKSFVASHNYNNHYCFLIDMNLPSGHNRFFVYDLQKDSILKSGLVTHGRCNQDWLEGRRYDNTVGCGCTSTGKYKIGHSYMGRFGLAFKLYGLDKTNDNAYRRYVVLHAHECVPASQVETEICQSDGCPTVSTGFLRELEPMIKNSGQPLLLWIFE